MSYPTRPRTDPRGEFSGTHIISRSFHDNDPGWPVSSTHSIGRATIAFQNSLAAASSPWQSEIDPAPAVHYPATTPTQLMDRRSVFTCSLCTVVKTAVLQCSEQVDSVCRVKCFLASLQKLKVLARIQLLRIGMATSRHRLADSCSWNNGVPFFDVYSAPSIPARSRARTSSGRTRGVLYQLSSSIHTSRCLLWFREFNGVFQGFRSKWTFPI
jgi:hypothetical protein